MVEVCCLVHRTKKILDFLKEGRLKLPGNVTAVHRVDCESLARKKLLKNDAEELCIAGDGVVAVLRELVINITARSIKILPQVKPTILCVGLACDTELQLIQERLRDRNVRTA